MPVEIKNDQSEVREAAAALKEATRDLGSALKHKATDVYEKGREYAVHGRDATRDYIEENPFKSVLIAFGVGLGLGIILSRRH
ncbi:MAG: DUF883 family protein [Planctomycetes bacterium]|nr:DUF883 family protein [Planctomycetota bacterium]